MVWPAVPLLEEKNLCTPKVQPVPVLASRREQSLAGTGGEGQGLGQEPHFSHSLSPVPGLQGHFPGSYWWLQS